MFISFAAIGQTLLKKTTILLILCTPFSALCQPSVNQTSSASSKIESETLFLNGLFQRAQQSFYKQDYGLSKDLYSIFLELSESGRLQDSGKILYAHNHLAKIYRSENRYDLEINHLLKCLELSQANPDYQKLTLYYLNDLGFAHYNLMDYEKCYFFYLQALKTDTQELTSIMKSEILGNIGLCYLHLGYSQKAVTFINESIALKKEFGSQSDLANSYNNLALVYDSRENDSLALEYYHKSLDLYQESNDSLMIALVLNNLGNHFLANNDLTQSLEHFTQSFHLREKIDDDNPIPLIQSLNNLAYTNFKLNNLSEAEEYNQRAEALNWGTHYKKGNNAPRSFEDYLVTIADRTEINLTKYFLTRDVNVLQENFELFISLMPMLMQYPLRSLSGTSGEALLENHERLFSTTYETAYLLDQIQPCFSNRILITSEIISTLHYPKNKFTNDIKNLSRKKEAYKEFFTYYAAKSQLAESLQKGGYFDSRLLDTITKYSPKLELAYQESNQAICEQALNHLDSIQIRISEAIQQTGRDPILGFQVTDSFVFIQIIADKEVHTFKKPKPEQFDSWAETFLVACKVLNFNDFEHNGLRLYQYLFSDIADILSGSKKITIIPGNYFANFPFEALLLEGGENPVMLIEKYLISYKTSLTKPSTDHQKSSKDVEFSFLGISADSLDETAIKENINTRELKAIAELFESKNRSNRIFSGDCGFQITDLQDYSNKAEIVHVSTHNHYQNNPISQGYYLVSEEHRENQLYYNLLSHTDFNCRLLFLNACQSGNNSKPDSKCTYSSFKDLNNKGIDYLVGTLWNILDIAAEEFAITFYNHILNDRDPVEALSLTKREFIANPRFNFPLFWAPYVIYEN